MNALLVVAVLAGTIIVVIGGRLFLKSRGAAAGAQGTGASAGLLAVAVGALVVAFAVPPTLNDFFPEDDAGTTAASGTVRDSGTGTAPADASPPAETYTKPAPTLAPPDVFAPAAPAPDAVGPAPAPAPATAAASTAPRTTSRTTTRRTTTSGGDPMSSPAAPETPTEPEPPAVAAAPVAPPAKPPAPVAPPLSPTPKPAVPPSPPPPQSLTVAVSCPGLGPSMQRGETFTMTYRIYAPKAQVVGLGAALLDPEGDDHSDGSGDDESFALPAGWTTISRPVAVPSSLKMRKFEVVGGLWPENKVGRRSAEVLDEASCGSFEVVG
jgi:hypothetical protein